MYRLLPSVVLCAAIAAQQTSAQPASATANRFVPADSVVVARMASPAKWKTRFSKTQVAKLMQGTTLDPLMQQARKGIEQGLEQLHQSGKFDRDLLDKMLTDYQGDITFSVQVDWEDIGPAMQEDRAPAFSMVVAMSPDASYDLAALGSAIQQAVEKESGARRPLKDLTIGDHQLRVTTDDSDTHACLPVMVDGHLVMVVGSDIEKAATKAFALDRRFEGAIGDKPLFVQARLDQAMSALVTAMDEQMGAMMGIDVTQMMSDLGFSALSGFRMSLDAEDKFAAIEAEMTLGDGDAGMWGAFLVPEQPKMLRFVPANAEGFSIGHNDLNALYDVVKKLWTTLADQVPMSMDDAEAAFAESSKVRLKEDLLAHLGTEVLTLQSANEDPDADLETNPMAMFSGSCFAFALRDGKAFGQSVETALRAHGLHAARKTEEYGDTKIYRLRLAAVFELEYAITDDSLLVVLGKNEGSSQNLRAILDTKKQGAGEGPAVLQKALASMPEGWTGVSVAPIAGMLQSFANLLQLGARNNGDEDSEELEQAQMTIRSLAGDAERLGIEHLVSTTYAKSRSMLVRMRL